MSRLLAAGALAAWLGTGCAAPLGLAALDTPPAVGASRPYAPPLPDRRRLPNGLEVWLLPRPGLPLVALHLSVAAGSSADPLARPGLAALTADMLDESTERRSALVLSADLEQLGIRLATSSGRDTSEVRIECLSQHLEPALRTLAELLTQPRFSEEDLERVRAVRLSELAQAREDPARIAVNLLQPLAFGPVHPYGHDGDGSPASLGAVTREELLTFFRARYRPEGALLVVSGDVSAQALMPLLADTLGAWRQPAAPAPVPPSPWPERPARMWVVDRPGASQTTLALGLPGLRLTDPDWPWLELVDLLLGGTFTSRLNLNLREAKGYTYGIFSHLEPSLERGQWLVFTQVQSEVTGPALAEILRELERMGRGDIGPEELAKAQASARNGLVDRQATRAGSAAALAAAALAGLRPEAAAERIALQARAAPGDLNRVARERLERSRLCLVLVGDWRAVQPQLAGLALPAPELVTAEGEPAPAPAPASAND